MADPLLLTKWAYMDPRRAVTEIAAEGASVATARVSSAQLLGLRSTPVVLVPAPGVGKVIVPTSYAVEYLFGTTRYLTIGNVKVLWHGTSNAPMSGINLASLFGATSSQFGYDVMANGNFDVLSAYVNLSIDLVESFSTWTAGDGTAVFTTAYFVAQGQ